MHSNKNYYYSDSYRDRNFQRSSSFRGSFRKASRYTVDERAMVKKSGGYDVTTDIMSSDKAQIAEEEGKKSERGNWGNPIEFLLACIGYAVGLGNVWRFPYLCYKNGGGAFLIPYVISLLIAGLPMFYLELCLGQFSSLGPNSIFYRLAPISQGIGWGMAVVSAVVSLYYNVIIAWVLYYFFASFRKTVLWSNCRNDWNTEFCQSNLETARCEELLGTGAYFFNKTCYPATVAAQHNETISNMSSVGPAQEFFENYVLNMSDSFENMGGLQWKLVLALLGAWIIVFLCLIKGVQSTGKVVYFTATFPYVVLIILLIRGCTLDGAIDGIKFYIVPDFSKLQSITVWKDAAVQIFFSLGPAFGGLITMSSYNKFSNNCFRDALIVAFTNCGTSVFAGFAIFSIAGFMAKDLGVAVSKVVRDGTGLAFIAYPEAITRMPVSPLWAILFFFMLVTLGLDSQFAMLETVTTAIMDQWPSLRKRKTWVVLVASAIGFLVGLPFCARNGIYLFTLFNDYSAGYCLITLALLEVLTVVYTYGLKNWIADLELMLGVHNGPVGRIVGPTGWYWRITWMAFTPVFLFVILIFSFVFYAKSGYGSYKFTPLAEGLGWAISLLSIIQVPIWAAYRLYRNQAKGKPLITLLKATVEWCPGHEREKRKARAEMHKMQLYSIPPVPQSNAPYTIPTAPGATVDTVPHYQYDSDVPPPAYDEKNGYPKL